MRIMFVCGSLELGHDGVGDYSRRLAGELLRRGHPVLVVALYDGFTDKVIEGQQIADGTFVDVLRIPSCWCPQDRSQQMLKVVKTFCPDWISLQFVPYSFHSKGLPFGISHQLSLLGKDRRWHVMFHELWLDDVNRPRHRIIAFVQRRIIRRLLAQLQPSLVDVSNRHNERRLRASGFNARTIAMVGNIPLTQSIAVPEEYLRIADLDYRLLYFGSPPEGRAADRILEGLVSFSRDHPFEVGIAVVGGGSEARASFVRRLKEELSPHGGQVVDLGFLASENLSALMRRCTAGVVRNSAYFVGKSGTAMAMLEHGLPIWLPLWSISDNLECEFRGELVFPDLNQACAAPYMEPHSLLGPMAASFVRELEQAQDPCSNNGS